MRPAKPIEDRFWPKVNRRGPDDCWLWMAACNRYGYGLIQHQGGMRRATHVALELRGSPRPSPPNDNALHSDKCVSRRCCNPNHLRWGSDKDNVADAMRLGRMRPPYVYGERQGSARMNDDMVRMIRRSAKSIKDLAAELGLDTATIGRAKRRQAWKHVE